MGQYKKIEDGEISDTADRDPQRALFMVLANSILDEAKEKATGEKPHEPKFHKSGWSIAIETPKGVVGLWSCWLNNQFYLGYPKDVLIDGDAQAVDELIMKILGVEPAQPVLQVDAVAVSEDYEGEYKDPDKPLVKNEAGQIVAYRASQQQRLWAKFYSAPVSDGKGRVWVDHSDFNSNSHHFDVVRFGSLENIYYGHDNSHGISTFQFSFWNKYAPDGPTTEPEIIQTYRNKFLSLACEIARMMGCANAVNINYSFAIVPEQLPNLGYQNVKWLKGSPGVRRGWGDEEVYAEKETPTGKEVIILKSGNSLVPWSTIRHVPYTAELTVEELIDLLSF